MRGRHVFDIPVYSSDEDEYERRYQRRLWQTFSRGQEDPPHHNPEFEAWKKDYGLLLRRPSWHFNEIVAFLHVFVEGRTVKIDGWTRLEKKRHNKTRPYRNTHRVAEAVFTTATSDSIRAAVKRAITQAETWALSRGWHADYNVSLVEAVHWERWLRSPGGMASMP